MTNYISSLTTIRSATLVAGFSTSLFTLGNVTSAYLGIVPATLQPDLKLSEKQKADLWLFFFRRAMIFPAATVIATLSFGTIAYATAVPTTQNVAIAGALCSAAVVPYTARLMMPVNNELTAISKGDSAKEPYAGKLVQKWADLHLVRMVVGAVAWGCAIYLREMRECHLHGGVGGVSSTTQTLDETLFTAARSLHHAVADDRLERVATLLSSSSSCHSSRWVTGIDAVDSAGYAPVLYVRSCAMLELLAEAGADLLVVTPAGRRSLLHRACLLSPSGGGGGGGEDEAADMILSLLRRGVVDRPDADGTTALQLAEKQGKTRLADLLRRPTPSQS